MKTATPCALVAAMLLAAGASARADDAARIAAIYPDVERLYQDLHRNPEIAFEEKRTAATLAKRLEAKGMLPLTDKSSAEEIYAEFGISKKAFKKALGALYKERLVRIGEDGVVWIG